MHNYTREDIIRIVEEEDVAFIRLQFTDIFGTLKNMAVNVWLMCRRWRESKEKRIAICICIRI